MSEKIKIFKLNDCDWWAGSDLESVKADYLKTTGETELDDTFDEPYELSDALMERLKFRRDDDNHTEVTFKEELARQIAEGQEFPCFFASTEY